MDWQPGDLLCAVTYEPDGAGDPQTVEVSLTDLDVLFPDVERCLRVAAVLTESLVRPGEMTVVYIGRWTSDVFVKNPGKFVYRDLTGLNSWRSECTFQYEIRRTVDNTGTYRPTPWCSIGWTDGSPRLNDIRVAEANFPGFTELCHVLCTEQRLGDEAAFRVLGMLATSLSFDTLRNSTGYFKEQLRLCGAVGMPADEIAGHLLAGLDAITQTALLLPDLHVAPA
jgi:hypothetical protein